MRATSQERAVRNNPSFLNEGNVPREIGHVGPTSLERGHIDRQDNRARAGAGGLPKEYLTTVASLRTTSRAIEQDPSGGPNIARDHGDPPRPRITNHSTLRGAGTKWEYSNMAVPFGA